MTLKLQKNRRITGINTKRFKLTGSALGRVFLTRNDTTLGKKEKITIIVTVVTKTTIKANADIQKFTMWLFFPCKEKTTHSLFFLDCSLSTQPASFWCLQIDTFLQT